MYSYNIIQWLFLFYFYCFFGWCFESAYVSVKKKKWVNRGFMKGPFLPLYGSGAIMMLVVSKPFLEHWWAVYIAGCIGATVLEYVTGVVMEALFMVRYWDYSKEPFNFQGHICLGSSLAWGGLTLLMNYLIHKPIEQLMLMIPAGILTAITFLLTVYIACDFTLAFKEALDLRDVLVQMEKAKDELYRLQKRLDVIIAIADDEWNNKKEAWSESVEQTKDAFAEGMERRKDAIAESIGRGKDVITESIGRGKDALADALRAEELRKSVEDGLQNIRERLLEKPEKCSKELKEEILNLRTEYKVHALERERIKEQKTLHRQIKNNPTISSVKYREALEELKRKLAEKKK